MPRQWLSICLVGSLYLFTAAVATVARAEDYEITFGAGGDCALLGGVWSQGGQTCVLVGLIVGPDDQLLIAAHANLIGNTKVFGTLESAFELTVNGHFENFGQATNHGTMRVLNRLTNHEPGVLTNQPASGLIVAPGALLENDGELQNKGLMFIQVQQLPFLRGTLVNRASFFNQGSLSGNATSTQIGGLLDNRATVTNLGTLHNTSIENRGQINGGVVDDDGPAKSTLTNFPSGSITGSSFSGLSFQNFGEMNGVFLGSGTLTNEPGGVIRVQGGQSFLLINSGLFEVVAPFLMVNTFVNRPGGIFVNRSTATNQALWTNHGLIENRGTWRNDGDAADQGVLNNHGKLINAVSLVSCLARPDLEQVNNFGVLANAGHVSSCGSTNLGSWYECGSGAVPAGLPVIAAVDADDDSVCSMVDCDDADSDAWGAPGEVRQISLRRSPAGTVQVEWSAAAYLGGNAVLYDLVSFDDAASPSAGQSCLSSGQSGLTFVDGSTLPPDSVRFLLPRAVGCAVGSAGVGSDGVPRVLAPCR